MMEPSHSQLQQRPKVLHCIPNVGLGGAVTVAFEIARLLREDFCFELFAVRGATDGPFGAAFLEQAKEIGAVVHLGSNVPMRFGGVASGAWELASVLRRSAPALVHLHTEIPEAAHAGATLISARARLTPVLRTIHNAVYWEFSPQLGRWCDRRLARASVAGVSHSAIAAFKKLRAASGAPNPPESTTLIYNGVQSRAPRTDSTAGSSGPLRIVFGGRLANEKGADLLPFIFQRVSAPAPHGGCLDIFGSGRHETLLKNFAAKPPLGWEVRVHAPTPDFAARLGEYDLAIIPSRNEGLALVAIEAILSCIPVVATSAFGLQEVFPPDYPWLALPDSAEKFAAVLQDTLGRRSEWKSVVTKARDFALQRFSPTAMADAYRELYTREIARNASRITPSSR